MKTTLAKIRGLQGAIAYLVPQRFIGCENLKVSRQQYAPVYKLESQRKIGVNPLYKRRMG